MVRKINFPLFTEKPLLEALLATKLNETELRIIMFIRQKQLESGRAKTQPIQYKEIQATTGKCRSGVCKAIGMLKEKGLLTVDKEFQSANRYELTLPETAKKLRIRKAPKLRQRNSNMPLF